MCGMTIVTIVQPSFIRVACACNYSIRIYRCGVSNNHHIASIQLAIINKFNFKATTIFRCFDGIISTLSQCHRTICFCNLDAVCLISQACHLIVQNVIRCVTSGDIDCCLEIYFLANFGVILVAPRTIRIFLHLLINRRHSIFFFNCNCC